MRDRRRAMRPQTSATERVSTPREFFSIQSTGTRRANRVACGRVEALSGVGLSLARRPSSHADAPAMPSSSSMSMDGDASPARESSGLTVTAVPFVPSSGVVGGSSANAGSASTREDARRVGRRMVSVPLTADGARGERGSSGGRGRTKPGRGRNGARGAGADDSSRASSSSASTTTSRTLDEALASTSLEPGGGRRGGRRRADFLLNFSHPPRASGATSTGGPRGGGGGRGGKTTRPTQKRRSVVYKKELFLQANFRFLVADSADLRRSAYDADHMVSWEDVVQVEAGSVEPLSCPVCFDDAPVAPQMTVCGHSFCFPCIARHILTTRGDGKPAKCPMCFTEIRLVDLRSVRRRGIKPPSVGKTQKFVLMARHRNSNVPGRRTAKAPPPPASGEWPRALPDCGCDVFAKYTLTGEEVAIATQECESLESHIAVLAEQSAVGELPFALAAVDAMTRRLDRWIERRCIKEGTPVPRARALPSGVTAPAPELPQKKMPEEFPTLPTAPKNMAYVKGSKVRVESAFTDDEDDGESDESETDEDPAIEDAVGEVSKMPEVDELKPSPANKTNVPHERTDIYYFYQAPDGQQVLLHSACLRVLLEHYGSYEELPLELEGEVVELERKTQDEDVRKRAAHIRHLPLTTEFVMVELDMKSLVPKTILDGTSGSELRQRAKRRAQKAAADARAKARELRDEARSKQKSQPFSKSVRESMPKLGDLEPAMPTPDTSMDAALARALAEQTEDERERMAMYEEVQNAVGPNGTSFSRIVGLGFASGGPDLNFNTESFGPALGATPSPVSSAAPTWGARSAPDIPDIPDGAKGKKKGKRGTVLFRMG